ncbi:DUF6448 family protein [[Mycobacterium] burgundiense]|uniref:DUF6448 family protein n=1 Tax=[Mycobacterium] burgundiense TaxID=3064286 RepID=A0ABM9M476_9MYCO|nr:DUF6448 family protein [Mycolicibacterium sp. MU0053]CAJ1509962.1 DUF6448 family protein [Mycolicibacterium sp. MU0053]
MIAVLLVVLGIAAAAMVLLKPLRASAHCDTMDGPVVQAGRLALEHGNVNYAASWVQPDGEAELRAAFDHSRAVRGLNDDARELADRYFLENLVRIHRAGEGAGFDGLKPSGAAVDEKVLAADRCIEVGSLDPLAGLVPAEQWPELQRRFDNAIALKNYDVDDVAAGRAYIAAYVRFFKFVEGEDHDHHQHGHRHADLVHH